MSMPETAQPVQREATAEEDKIQTKPIAASITPLVQREAMPEEEEVQAKAIGTLQREEMPEEEEVQTKAISSIQREEMPEEEEVQTKPALQRSPDGGLEAGSSIESRLNSSKGGGEPLSDEVRSFMEPRFGADFSQVRVHTGSEAVQMNRDLNAQAFTHQQDVYFGAGKAPGRDALTAHELTHIVQQTGDPQRRQGSHSPDVQCRCGACQNSSVIQHSPQTDPLREVSSEDLTSISLNRSIQSKLRADTAYNFDQIAIHSTVSPAIQRLDQSAPYAGALLSYLNPINQLNRAVLPGLSPKQKALLDRIFGNSLATSIIRLNPNSVLATGNCYRTTGNIINMPGNTISDKSLIHEAAHVWQSQNTWFGVGYAVSALKAQAIAQLLGGDWQRAYNYTSVEKYQIPWRYWNAEQQAQWIEDKESLPSGWMLQSALPDFGIESAGIE
ncbi:MAG: DUF4157 domain-containing protein [Leptolyngbyaceae cyanobacterium SU_3_3]|nr:DUF4157 domain-containing protein [Leptolyngbyaceae cyanobacterium SU_3_3]